MPRQAESSTPANFRRATAVFRKHGGVLRMAEAIRAGIHRRTLYAMRDRGITEQLSRGLYRLAAAPAVGHPDLITVALKVPKGVICLISALAFHDLTTQIPHEIYLAVPRDSEPPRLTYPPIRVFRFSPRPFAEGIEVHELDGVSVRIYGREKTLADCFKYRNKIGLDTVVEALRRYREKGRVRVDTLMHFAAVCRVSKIMQPYVEAIL